MVEALLSALIKQIQQDLSDQTQSDALNTLVTMASSVLDRFGSLTSQAGSRKKVYTVFMTKCFSSLLFIRRQLSHLMPACPFVAQLSTLLCQVLYHRDTIFEYNSILLESDYDAILHSSNKSTSYVSKLFTEAAALMDLDETSQLDDGSQQYILASLDKLMQIDISLVEPSMSLIWPVLVQPNIDAEQACFAFGKTVLELYAASRQVDTFVDELLNTIDALIVDDIHATLKKPLFSKLFLKQFAAIISKHVPGPQIVTLFDRFTAALNQSQDSAKQATSMLLVSSYMVCFVSSLRLGFHQRRWFEQSSVQLFTSLLQPSMLQTTDNVDNALPALQVHFALANAFYDVYWLKLDPAVRDELASHLSQRFLRAVQQETQTSMLFMIYSTNVLFQHLYYSAFDSGCSLSSTRNVSLIEGPVNAALQASQHKNTTWDGQLESIKTLEQVQLALWKLMLDEWFDTVSAVLEDDKLGSRLVTEILLGSHMQTAIMDPNLVTRQQISLTLLRSANFYEAKLFHDKSVATLLSAVTSLFETMAKEDTNLIIVRILDLDLDAPHAVPKETVASLSELLVTSLSSPVDKPMTPDTSDFIQSLSHYIDVLLLFPVDFYRKSDRSHLLWLFFLVDAWLLTFAEASDAVLRCSLSCRSMCLRFMNTMGSIGVLNANPALLHWMVTTVHHWQNSDVALVQDKLEAWTQVTTEIDIKVLGAILSMASGKSIDKQTASYLQYTVEHRLASFSPANLLWTLNLVKMVNQYLPSFLRKEGSLQEDPTILGTYTGVTNLAATLSSDLSQYNACLENNDDLPVADLKHLSLCLQGVSFVQDYSQMLASLDFDMSSLVVLVPKLVTPYLSWLPPRLAQQEALSTIGPFVSAICSILAPLKQDDKTVELFDIFTTVFGLVLDKDTAVVDALNANFAHWIRHLSHDQLLVLAQRFVLQSNSIDLESNVNADIAANDVLLSMISLLTSCTKDGQKQAVRPYVSIYVTKVAAMAGKSKHIRFLDRTLDLLQQLTGEKIMYPKNKDDLECQLTRQLASSMHRKIGMIMANIARLHRDPLSDTIGPFVAILDALLQCFKSSSMSLVQTRPLVTSNASSTNTPSSEPSKKKRKTDHTLARCDSLLQAFAPLDTPCAERFTRVISELTSKNTGDKRSDLVFHHISKHAPYMLLQYFVIQSDPIMNITVPAIKSSLTSAWHELLNLCNADDRMFILVGLNATGQELFKTFYATWKRDVKYSGQ
ncbi:hypothetical protein DM01DRAFT_310112 [Hesseltinella vesiculosa]|uniref:Nucleolar 27S pre-rRNA processing Urb2/Npa2 C-terminal domain-containing protein n=1 Tax=Hesseltinella vesiculosa TaxID=101127 RepID=A0A1X2G3H7_9FUNG|nr:hypothetical protein DM01DRAFT_310112 [Hesseltinella vesiculosa]